MNSEELEVSLRSEFETYLKNVLAEMRQEISQLQEKVSTELERHKSQLDEVFQLAAANFEKEHEFDVSFKESVVEHLRLARDEGAQITAMAIARAEEMEKETAPSVGIKEIYEAVNEISSKPSQSEILKTLVHHATHFAPRGAFFIVKNEHLVGWRVFGKEKGAAEEKVREVFLPIGSESVLSESVKSLATVANENGGLSSDAEILEKLEFGAPQRMVAIPLVARGRGVAVLYADYGNEGADINIEALETLVRVAGLTVEVLASNKTVATSKKSVGKKNEETASNDFIGETGGLPAAAIADYQHFSSASETATVVEPAYESVAAPAVEEETSETETESETSSFADDDAKLEENQFDYAVAEDETAPQAETEPETEVEQTPVAEFSDSYLEETPVAESSSSYAEETPVAELSESYTDSYTEETPTVEYSDSYAKEKETVKEEETSVPVAEFENFSYSPVEESQPVETPVEFETTSSWSVPVSEVAEETVTEEKAPEVEETASSDYNADYSYQAETEEKYPAFETNSSWSSTATEPTQSFSAQEFAENFAKETDPVEYAKDFSYQVETNESAKEYAFQAPVVETTAPVETVAEAPAQEFVPTKEQTFEVENGKTESYAAPKSRLSERNVDLPIEVGEDERRLHNDARRFARLLVSEIKLYNEQKVKEGRDSSDLYDRLKEAIDRSREMYDKRVQPPVAAKFDYFHYELVNTLAEGDDNKLGTDYPGSAV